VASRDGARPHAGHATIAMRTPSRQTQVAGSSALLDQLMPESDFGHRYEVEIDAAPAAVAEAIEAFSIARDSSPFVRLLLRLRGLRVSGVGLRDSLAGEGFTVLAERRGEEIVAGIAGRFWALDEPANLIRVPDAKAFREFNRPGTAKAVANFRLEPLAEGRTRLSTETRVKCADRNAHLRFALYWALIRPFSLWIRRDMLRAIARRVLASRPSSG
jgi:uncharacterized protein DUF2867